MLKAEVFVLNNNGSLSFNDDDLILQFDDIYAEAGDLVEKATPLKSHRNGEYLIYELNFIRGGGAALELINYTQKQ